MPKAGFEAKFGRSWPGDHGLYRLNSTDNAIAWLNGPQVEVRLKRLLDVMVSSAILFACLPLMAVIALAVKASSPGDVIYRSRRVGRYAKPFYLYKFRTMITDADRIGPLVTSIADRRITRVGWFLRRSKLDELPSLLNVLKGEMSLVGPRPENERSVALYNDRQRTLLNLLPGITSLATIKYRNEEEMLAAAGDLETAYYHIMQDKLQIELEYLSRCSLWLDLKIVFLTIVALLRPVHRPPAPRPEL